MLLVTPFLRKGSVHFEAKMISNCWHGPNHTSWIGQQESVRFDQAEDCAEFMAEHARSIFKGQELTHLKFVPTMNPTPLGNHLTVSLDEKGIESLSRILKIVVKMRSMF